MHDTKNKLEALRDSLDQQYHLAVASGQRSGAKIFAEHVALLNGLLRDEVQYDMQKCPKCGSVWTYAMQAYDGDCCAEKPAAALLLSEGEISVIADETVKVWIRRRNMPPLAWDFRGFATDAINAEVESLLGIVAVEALQEDYTTVKAWAMTAKVEFPDGAPIVRLMRSGAKE